MRIAGRARRRCWLANFVGPSRDSPRAGAAGSGLTTVSLIMAGMTVWTLMPPPDPIAVKRMKAAEAAYRRGELQPAIEHYSQVLMAAPESGEAYFGRGRALMKMGDFTLASGDFAKSFKFSHDARAKACVAYCMGRRGAQSEAIDFGQSAIDLGYVNAAVYNNLGYAQLQTGALEDADKSLGKAIELNKGLQAAYNRARVDRQRLWEKDYLPRNGLDCIRTAIDIPPPAADLYFDAAYTYRRVPRRWTGHDRTGACGTSRTRRSRPGSASFKKDATFAILASESRFQDLMKAAHA